MTTIINGSSPSITFSDSTTQTTAFTTTPTINTITSAASTALTLQSAGTTAVTVDTSQKVGIGTSSPAAKLDVLTTSSSLYAGYFTFVASGYGLGIRNSTGGSTVLVYFFSPNYVGEISTNGTGTTYSTASDYRLKENVLPMTNALSTVSALKPVTYKWKADGSDGQGFIAHELQAIVPDAVTGEKDALDADGKIKPQGIDTSFLVATLTAAIQELNAKVDAQATTIAELQAKVG
jgi:hypothetical protein